MKKKQYPDYGDISLPLSLMPSYDSEMIGRLVRSKSGRDKGRYYLVHGSCSRYSLFLQMDKKELSLTPRRKNIRHVQIVHKVAADLMNKKNGELPQ